MFVNISLHVKKCRKVTVKRNFQIALLQNKLTNSKIKLAPVNRQQTKYQFISRKPQASKRFLCEPSFDLILSQIEQDLKEVYLKHP